MKAQTELKPIKDMGSARVVLSPSPSPSHPAFFLSGVLAAQRKTRVMGGVTKEQVESSLNTKLSPSHLEVVDTSGGCGASFNVVIVSGQFEGKRLLDRHRLVNAALEEEMKEIHALSIKKVLTPEQWKQQQEAEKA